VEPQDSTGHEDVGAAGIGVWKAPGGGEVGRSAVARHVRIAALSTAHADASVIAAAAQIGRVEERRGAGQV